MITLTRLDGKTVCVNETNILWVEALPDTCIMLLGGGRVLVKQTVEQVKEIIETLVRNRIAAAYDDRNKIGQPSADLEDLTRSIVRENGTQGRL